MATLEEVIRQRLAEATEQSKEIILDPMTEAFLDDGEDGVLGHGIHVPYVADPSKTHVKGTLTHKNGQSRVNVPADILDHMQMAQHDKKSHKIALAWVNKEKAKRELNESQIDEEFDSIDTYSLEELDGFMVSEDFEQLDEISGKLLGSYIQKARKDISNKNQHDKDLDDNPKVAKLKSKLHDYYNRREYTKSGDSKHQKAIDSTQRKITDIKKEIDPSYPESLSTYKRHKGVEKAATKLQYGKLTEEQLDEMSQEEFDSIDEEQLDELSKATLGSYIKAASRGISGTNRSLHSSAGYNPTKEEDKKKMYKRIGSLNKTVDKLTKEDTVSSQVASLLEAEGLSDEFKVQAVTIFEAAVTDRVLTIEEELKEEFETQLSEAKAELDNDIDGFLSEAIHQWKQENEVAIKSNFKTQLAESFMDGLMSLIKEHNIELPEGSEDALEVALGEVDKLTEEVSAKVAEMSSLQEQVNALKGEKILESFKSKMTTTEFDRFAQLTESVTFKDEAQYEKQLTVVLENFGTRPVTTVTSEPVVEVVTEAVHKIVTESRDSSMDVYTKYLTKKH